MNISIYYLQEYHSKIYIMLYEISNKGSFRNDSRYPFCDRKNDKRRRYLLIQYHALF